ncbi:ribonuclease HII-domain-containing protein [Scheffersomyces xylosifermentans]|uniref:ribonuclease HII-domain-containing protein n=1 Tax=Scheffersomyces xylosifermentans TaxID=1304137 RepID=UPI00315D0238
MSRSPRADSSDEEQNAVKRRKLEVIAVDNEFAKEEDWYPISVSSIENHQEFKSSTYHSPIPQEVLSNPDEPVVLGVDEAGRGPVLGPMVYGIAYALEKYSDRLQKQYGFADSKTLKEDKRDQLFGIIENKDHELNKNVGWATTSMTARDISSGMLRSVLGVGNYNLNEQAHDTTIQLIKEVVAKGVNIKKVFVDTVGPPTTYQAKLQKIFPDIQITVAKKADSIYPIVSTASVVAKVTRDANLRWYNTNLSLLQGHKLGSGYPSDPNTSKWLNSNVDKVFGWCYGFIRFSWQTSKDSLVKNGGVEVIYEEECVKEDNGYGDVSELFGGKKQERSCIDKSYYASDDVSL